ncbi:zinc ribbon domain-containing protein [Streptomyces populi]
MPRPRTAPSSPPSRAPARAPRELSRKQKDRRTGPGIAVEDLAVAGPARTRPARSVHDAGRAQLVNMPEYKAQRYGRTLVKIGRFAPASRTCHTCGVVDGPEPLNVRERTCAARGTLHDRGHHAELDIEKAAGPAASACGAPVGPEPVPARCEETGSHALPTTGGRAAQRHGHRSRRPESSPFRARSMSRLAALSQQVFGDRAQRLVQVLERLG